MVKLIKRLKNIIPLNGRILFAYIKNINHNPYSLNSLLSLDSNISDFFIWDKDCLRIGFTAENIRAILLGYPVEVIHHFKFFSKDGSLINHQSYKTSEFFHKILFNPIDCNDKYISFIHYVESESDLKEIFNKKNGLKTFKWAEQNRGYTTYYPYDTEYGLVVHGNFGGISKNLDKTARQTFLKHIYTPIYRFDKDSSYDLVFNNPTRKEIFINIILNGSSQKSHLKIPSMGTRFYRVNKYKGSVSFISKLPICRALVFKNPTKNLLGNFDVFHT